MTKPAHRIHASIAHADGRFQFVVLHPSLVATTAREAERLAVQAEGGLLQRGQTRMDVDLNGAPIWSVTLSANASAARYWGPKACAARRAVETIETVETVECIHLDAEESAVYDSGDDIAGRDLARNLKSRVRDLLTRGIQQVEILHAAGFVAWVYDLSDFGGAL